MLLYYSYFFFFFNDTATTEIYTLSLHDALPIYLLAARTPPRMTAMLFDRQRHLVDLDLLDDARCGGRGVHALAAGGPELPGAVGRPPVELCGRERGRCAVAGPESAAEPPPQRPRR